MVLARKTDRNVAERHPLKQGLKLNGDVNDDGVVESQSGIH